MVFFTHRHKEDEWEQYDMYKKVFCPVCKDYENPIGMKLPAEIKTFTCEECNTEYTFYPNCQTPSSKVKHLQPEECHCPSCQIRRESQSE